MTNGIVILIDISGIIIGAGVIVFMLGTINKLKITLNKYKIFYSYTLIGITFQFLALVYTLLFSRLKIFPFPGGIDIHHLLMIIGMVFFAYSVFHLRDMLFMASGTKKKN